MYFMEQELIMGIKTARIIANVPPAVATGCDFYKVSK